MDLRRVHRVVARVEEAHLVVAEAVAAAVAGKAVRNTQELG